MSARTCTHCGETKHELAFAIDRRSPNGLNHQCRECVREYTRRHGAEARTERAKHRAALARFTPLPGAS